MIWLLATLVALLTFMAVDCIWHRIWPHQWARAFGEGFARGFREAFERSSRPRWR